MNLCPNKAYVVFNKICVNQIEDSSGIFIGTNQAIGWYSYSKSNKGFGDPKNSCISNVLSVVHDEDVIDMPIKDVRSITLPEGNHPLQQSKIDFNSIHANAVLNGSAIDLGNNTQLGWRSSRKNNYGFGKSLGRNQVNQVASVIFDDDIVDTPMFNQETSSDESQNRGKDVWITQKNNESS